MFHCVFHGQSASRLMNCNSCHAGKANVSVPSRRVRDAFGGSCRVVGPVSQGMFVPTAQVERDFKLGLARLNICKQARQRHRQRPLRLVLFGFWSEEKLGSSVESSVEKPQVTSISHVRMSEFKARVEDEQEVLVPWVIRVV